MTDLNSLVVTIRSSGERTEKACIQSVLDEGISRDKIHIVREAPFKKALEECFKIASESGAKWLLTLDADMILIPDVVEKMYQEAEKMPGHFIQIQAQILDKFYGEVRRGGPRIYRVKHLLKALKISQTLDDNIRPETNIIQKMGSSGHPARYISPAIALHDFEQYYADIYRKACVYAVKHLSKLPVILEQVVKYRSDDADYKVILKGIYDSLSKDMDVKIDNRIFTSETENALADLELKEKSDIPEVFNTSQIISDYSITNDELSFSNCSGKDVPSTRVNAFKSTLRHKGLLRSTAIYLGVVFSTVGKSLTELGKTD